MNTIVWQANYKDGTNLQHFKDDKVSYADIDRSRLESFSFYKKGKRIFTLVLDEGQRLIFRKRSFLSPGKPQIDVYLIGWQATINGKNIQAINYIYPDGVVELRGAFKGKDPLFGDIVLIEQEKNG